MPNEDENKVEVKNIVGNKEAEDSFIERVEKAASKGAAKGARKARGRGVIAGVLSNFLTAIIIALVVLLIFCYIRYSMGKRWDSFVTGLKDQFSFGVAVANHDLVLSDHGLFGYKVADFAEAVLGDSSQLKKLEVYEQDIVDVATITEAGFANVKIFEKNQVVTYHGTAVYTIDLSKLSEGDFSLDEENKRVIIRIPHCEMEQINIPENLMEFGDVNRGWLAFGDVKITPEQSSELQKKARERMEEKLEETKALDQADRFAKMSVWELYQPVVSSVSSEYTLEVEFR